MLFRFLLALAASSVFVTPAQAAFDVGDLICETTTTTGTGTVNLAGAVTNYVTFVSQIASGNTVPYHIRASDGKLETGVGTFTDATPDTLSRTADWSTDGSGAELTLAAGTHTVCLGPISGSITNNPMTEALEPNADATFDIGTSALGIRDIFITSDLELNGGTDTTLTASGAGEATLEGDAVKHAGKQMMYIAAGSMRNSATSSASCGDTYDSGSNDLTITVCAFDTGATEERAEFGFSMPKAWNESTVTFVPLSTCAGACAATETLIYELACASISDSDTMNSAQGTPVASSKTLQATPTNELLVGAESTAITVANTPNENDYVHCRISRDTSVDTMAGDALLIGVRFFWTDNASTLAE
jgi:hypothetical protein